ncbi:MAG: alpha/beta hydrolase [Anaerolineaceae bacterium]
MKDEPIEFTQTYDLYLKGEYSKAYDLITSVCDHYLALRGRAYEIRFNLAAMMGQLDLAETIFEQALDLGYFYNEFVLRKDEDIKVLHGRPRYESLVERSFRVLAGEQHKAKPELKLLEPNLVSASKLPLLIGLHGNNSHAEGFSDYWGFLTNHGWLVALPQSAEVSGKGLFVWNDIERFERDIPAHYEALKSGYQIDDQKTILAGFSKGGHAAIHLALKRFFPLSGFLALAPYIGDVNTWLPLLNSSDHRNLRGYFVLGGKDDHCTPGAVKLKEELTKVGVKCEMEVIPEMAHDIPSHFDEVLQRAVSFILKE